MSNTKCVEAVAKALSTPDVFLIQGPPGTGKSRVIAEIIAQAAAQSQRDDQSKQHRSHHGACDRQTQIACADERFAEAKPPQNVRLTGEVSHLDNSTRAPVHLITLDVNRGADVSHARVRLTPEQYEIAVAAHAQHRWLSVSGQLQRDGCSDKRPQRREVRAGLLHLRGHPCSQPRRLRRGNRSRLPARRW